MSTSARLALLRCGVAVGSLAGLVNPTGGHVKHPGDVILPPIAFPGLRAKLAASCSLVSLAVQSLRSM
ncbi:hypothetical protein D3X13_14920 [Streptomyces fradiae]|nr:hypothetical protein D3X13_14920 [Streptomyces fradiae]